MPLPSKRSVSPEEKHFGLRGTYYPLKVAILQALTVAVQAFGKVYLLGGIVTFAEYQEGESASTTLSLRLGFWTFCALLCWNSVYPALLLFFSQSAFARIGAALMDAALDLGYILTYLGIASRFHVGVVQVGSLTCLAVRVGSPLKSKRCRSWWPCCGCRRQRMLGEILARTRHCALAAWSHLLFWATDHSRHVFDSSWLPFA